jgi:hypothetical protein
MEVYYISSSNYVIVKHILTFNEAEIRAKHVIKNYPE